MKTKFALPLFVAALTTATVSTTASADDVLNVLVGTGAGIALGHAIGGHNGAVAGGVIGAIAGVAASQPRVVYQSQPVYTQRTYTHYEPAVVYPATRVVYSAPVVYHDRDWHEWHHDRDWHDWHHDRHDYYDHRDDRHDDDRHGDWR
jgi:hypothetical protein